MQPAAIIEMCARTYDETSGKIQVEPKEDMKKRIKRSPDIADSTFLSIFVGRRRHGLAGKESFPKSAKVPQLTENMNLTAGNPDHPMANLTSWGKKQRKALNIDETPVDAGGGWGEGW
jgi:hypothetical protein